MAEFAAHVTSTRSEHEGDPPSIFDVLAQESLVQSLKPALKHVLRLLAEKSPARFGWLYRLGDEVYALLQLVLENYYLKHTAGSFAENFYGLKRVLINNKNQNSTTSSGNKLPRASHLKSLLFLVLVPYVKNKSDEWYEELQQQKESGHHFDQTLRNKLYGAFLGAYPLLHMLWEGAMFAYQLAYTLGKSRYHSPYLPLAGLRLEYLLDGDAEPVSEPLMLRDKSWPERAHLFLNKALSFTAVGLASGLSVGVFFLQFLEWWYASDQHAASLTALPTPSPPQMPLPESVPRLHTVCPLCNKVRTNDTALCTTGYVFCYPCIYSYVKQHNACPVTSYPAQTDQLLKLYLPER